MSAHFPHSVSTDSISTDSKDSMKALIYTKSGAVDIVDRPEPTIQAPTDAIVRMLHASICGTDLHILKGDVPSIQPGVVLGHEGVGVVEALGDSVKGLQVGDRVVISCMTCCGACRFCQRGMPSHCEDGGWVLGNRLDGTQAEYVRVPHATLSLHRLHDSLDSRAAVTLSDALPTGLECGVLSANVQPGASVVIVGAGPVGMAALLAARLYTPSLIVMVDLDDSRLAIARTLGANHTVNSSAPDAKDRLLSLTQGQGYDSVIEAVGIPATFTFCQELVAIGGRIANVGVHGTKVDLHLEKLWDRNISIHMSLCNATSTPRLLQLAESGMLDLSALVTHHFPFPEAATAYDTFKAASVHGALKVALDFIHD
ncbi:zinc-binding oxidoreductase [Aspergillus ochraceoroseus]|uniref:Zinc-binding oxidoreductase n=2 Tax=Aspergillus ochraceoroseus TaxID=138278 RepID=A0A0F8ULR2_9EURO|nr:zinc-binding oxidoreductase [Aspergillus ochraceoroseus]